MYVEGKEIVMMSKKDYDEMSELAMLNEHEEFYEYSCYTTSKKGFRNSDLCAYEVAIPTLYDAQKWLRDNHNTHLNVRCTSYCKPLNRHDYMCEIFALSCSIFSDTKIYHKYEEALNEGILLALDII